MQVQEAPSLSVGIVVLQVATLVVQAFLMAFTAYLAFRAEEAKRDREAQAKGLHRHLTEQTIKLLSRSPDGKGDTD